MAQAITRKIRSILVVRGVLLTLLAMISVVFSTLALEHMLIKNALEAEAKYFWNEYNKNPQFPAPNTWNLKSYLIDLQLTSQSNSQPASQGRSQKKENELFSHLIELKLGFTRLKDQPGYTLLYKTKQENRQLLLIFDGENVRSLAVFLGIIPLTLFLLLSYLVGWVFYRKAQQVLSPITWLTSKFEKFDPQNPNLSRIDLNEMPNDADYEALTLANSLSDYATHIEQFVARERAFTRDVSHELRTPLTVINMAVQIMEADNQLSSNNQKTLSRIKNASKDMLELVEVFLILARESENQMEEIDVNIRDVIDHQLDQSEYLLEGKEVVVKIKEEYQLTLNSSAKILEVLLGNLIRNALKYTDSGTVLLEINKHSVIIQDSGIGMSEQQISQIFTPYFRASHRPDGGHGVGLTIVKRISDRFNWPVKIESQQAQGTTVTVQFD